MDNITDLLVEQIIEKTKEKIKESLRVKNDLIKNIESKLPQWYQETIKQIEQYKPEYQKYLPSYSKFRSLCKIKYGFQMRKKSSRTNVGYDVLGLFVSKYSDDHGVIMLNTQYLLSEERWKSVFIHELLHYFERSLHYYQRINLINDDDVKQEILSKFTSRDWNKMSLDGFEFTQNNENRHSELWIELQTIVNKYFGKQFITVSNDVPTGKEMDLIKQSFSGKIFIVMWRNEKKGNRLEVQFTQSEKSLRYLLEQLLDSTKLNGVQILLVNDQSQIYQFEKLKINYNQSTQSISYYNFESLKEIVKQKDFSDQLWYLTTIQSEFEFMEQNLKENYEQVYLEKTNEGLEVKLESSKNPELNKVQKRLEEYFKKSQQYTFLNRIVIHFGVVFLPSGDIKYCNFMWDTKIPTNYKEHKEIEEITRQIKDKTKKVQDNIRYSEPYRIEYICLDKKEIIQLKEIFDKHNISKREVIDWDIVGNDLDWFKKKWNRRIKSVINKMQKYTVKTSERKKYSDGSQYFEKI